MAVYRQVKLSFWTDSFICDNFSAEDKYFYLYALTNQHTNLCGCYDVSFKQMAGEMGYSIESIASIIDRFEHKYNLIRYDRRTNELLILNWSKHNWTDSPKFRKPLEKEIELVKNTDFRSFLTAEFKGEEDERYRISIPDTVSETSDTLVSICSVNTDNSSKDNSLLEPNNLEDKPVKETKRTRKKYEDTPEFKAFWDAYPVQANKVRAREEFAKADAPLEVLLKAIETWKHTDQWNKEGGKYIPYPAKWLKERRWEDSPKVNMPKTDGMERYSNLKRLAEEFENE